MNLLRGLVALGLLNLALACAVARAATPAEVVRGALADARSLSSAGSVRYLSLAGVPAGDRAATIAAVNFVANAVSRSRVIARVELVGGGDLLRVDLAAFGLPGSEWEKLAVLDPYFHIRTLVLASKQAKKPVEVFTDGGWVGLPAAAELRGLTGSAGGVLRADWFVVVASKPPVYYDLAGVPPKLADFYKLLGVDAAAVRKLGALEGANTIYSGVTRKVRRVVREQGPLGGFWGTFDVARSTAERDPFRNPLGFVFDAGEYIAAKPNGLHLFALYDARGARADSVPDVIAKDTSEPAGDGIILPMISCVRCHVEDGLRPVANDQRRLLAGEVDLLADDPRRVAALVDFYDSPAAERNMSRDREDYALAVRAATGLAVAEGAAALAGVTRRYQYELVTPAVAARELAGVELAGDAARDWLRARLGGSHDPVLLALVAGIAVQREQWEASYAEGAVLAAGDLAVKGSSR